MFNIKNKNDLLFGALCIAIVALSGSCYFLHKGQKTVNESLAQMHNANLELAKQLDVPSQIVEKVVSKTVLWRPIQEQIKDTVVQIFSQVAEFDMLQPYRTPQQYSMCGSGFFINNEGDIITNAHVINQARSIWVQIPSLGRRIIEVEVVGMTPDRDIALLRVKPSSVEIIKSVLGSIPYLPLGDSDSIHRSDEVMAVGYPLGQQSLKSTTGVVSGREQHLVQISAAINPGSSGGPLINEMGQVIGINAAGITEAQNIGYAIPINDLKITLPDLYKTKLLRKPFLGILYNNGSYELTEFLGNPHPGGCYVIEVVKGSTLYKAGVKQNDMIYQMNGYPVDMYGDMCVPWTEDKISLLDFVSRIPIGEKVHLVVYRHGERKEFTVSFDLTELPAIRKVFPGYEPIDYEVIAGMVVMPLTLNHIQIMEKMVPGLTKFGEIKHQGEPVLVITHIFGDSHLYKTRILTPGSTIREINGVRVTTLEEFRKVLRDSSSEKFLTIKASDNLMRVSDNLMVVLSWDKVLDEEMALARDYHYPLSPIAKDLIAAKNHQKLSVHDGLPMPLS